MCANCTNCSYNCKTLFSLCDSFVNFNFGLVYWITIVIYIMQFIFVYFRCAFKFETLFDEETVYYAASDDSGHCTEK